MSPITTICLHCSLRSFVDDRVSPVFEESIENHMARVHPDPAATRIERNALEREAYEKILRERRTI